MAVDPSLSARRMAVLDDPWRSLVHPPEYDTVLDAVVKALQGAGLSVHRSTP